ncbi:MAG: lysoplasmalogenase [Erysipelotrichaceae bacterium]|nr:lysoplasmalogenase [Erysipelotrichaceae bacterium]
MKYIRLVLFGVFSLIHLYDSFFDNSRARKKTKPFLLLFLTLFYLLAAREKNYLLVAALIFSWLGDVLLIPKGDKWFFRGGIAFGISHLFFIAQYIPHISFDRIPWVAVIPAAIVYFGISFAIIEIIKPTTPKSMLFPMYLYLLCNSAMNLFSFNQLLQHHNIGAALALIGAIMFFLSDCALFIVRYGKNPKIVYRKHFTVMLAYLMGEFLIVLGMLKLTGQL